MFGRWAAPHPRVGTVIELFGSHPARLIQIGRSTEILPCQRFSPKEPPPALHHVQPTGFGGDEDLVDSWMLGQPGLNGRTLVAGEVICYQIQVTRRVVLVDGLQEAQIPSRVTGGGSQGQRVPIAHAQRPVEPDLLWPATVLQRRFDAMPIGRPARGWCMQAWGYWPEFIRADGRPGRVGVERDDGGPFGPKFRSVLLAQE
jgi:hypothetical protein